MDDLPNIHDLLHAGSTLAIVAVAVHILWKRFDRHEQRDDDRFDSVQERLNQLSDRVGK